MRWQIPILSCLLTLVLSGMASGRQPQSSPDAASSPGKEKSGAPSSDQQSPEPRLDPDTELRATVQQSMGDNAKLLQNLQAYLDKYPQTPRRVAIYRGMMQAAMQMNDPKAAL